MGAKIQEGRAWDPANSDGSLNLGSYEVLPAHPAPDITDRDAVAAWGVALGDTAARLLVTAVGLVDEDHATRAARRNWPDVNTAKHRLLNAVAAAHPPLAPEDHKAAAAEAWANAELPDAGTVPAADLAAVIATVGP